MKYIGINYGIKLDSFFSGLNQSFKVSKKEKESNLRMTAEIENKLKHDEIPILLFRKAKVFDVIKESLFLFSWLVKIFVVTFVMKKLKKTSSEYFLLDGAQAKSFKRRCKFVYWVKLLEFIFFNLVICDGLFIMIHCLTVIRFQGIKNELDHYDSFSGKLGFLLRLIGSLLIFIAILVDILEILTAGLKTYSEGSYIISE